MFGAGAAQQYAQMIAYKTSLQHYGDKMVGQFQGLRAWTQTRMVADVPTWRGATAAECSAASAR